MVYEDSQPQYSPSMTYRWSLLRYAQAQEPENHRAICSWIRFSEKTSRCTRKEIRMNRDWGLRPFYVPAFFTVDQRKRILSVFT